MLETDSLYSVMQLNIDAEIIGIQLELVAVTQPTVFVHRHGQGSDHTIHGQRPVPVALRGGLVVNDEGFAHGSPDAISCLQTANRNYIACHVVSQCSLSQCSPGQMLGKHILAQIKRGASECRSARLLPFRQLAGQLAICSRNCVSACSGGIALVSSVRSAFE